VDVHGAGAQRSDPKAGDPAMFPHGRGPQGDVIRINNFVRLVRTAPGRDASSFILRSPEVVNGGTLPKEFTGDGDSATLPLEWKGAPAGTKSYALIMHHIDPEGRTKWYWILYEIPATVQSLPKNVKGVGTLGNNSINGRMEYAPPHSKGPGPKEYIFTVYALSAPPQLDVQPAQVNREILLAAMKDRILGSAELQVVYTRSGEGDMPGRPGGPPPGGPNRQGREDQRPKQAAQEAPDPDATKEAETAK
jgi:Raf kinase inhibitor-like YbhB/YbcL family protein